jgi:fucose 4-O-acetylase-like acetyltransferase
MEAQTQKRSLYVDAMKGLGILLVVLCHFAEYFRGASPIINGVFECVYLFHMALFCICSGIVAKFSVKKLFAQQLWLYLVSQGIMLVFRLVVMAENPAEQGGLVSMFLLPWRQMWYLYALMFWDLTAPLLRLARRHVWSRFAGLAAALAVGLLGGYVDWPFLLGRVVSFYPFFAFGCLFGDWLGVWDRVAQRSRLVRLSVLAPLVLLYGFKLYGVLTAPEPVYEGATLFNEASYAVGGYTVQDRGFFLMAGILTSLALIALAGRGKALAWLGRRTLPVYILHMPILVLFTDKGLYGYVNPFGLAAILPTVLLCAGATILLLSSGPVYRAFSALANCWYKRRSSGRDSAGRAAGV